jgi:hypothetical protein
MFDKYIICDDLFNNLTEDDQVVGFQFNGRLPYYRGLGICMVENLEVSVDEETFPRQAIRVTLHGNTYSLSEMETEYEDRWEFGEPGTVTVLKPGGLKPGEHKVTLADTLRISYLPWPLVGKDSKVLTMK